MNYAQYRREYERTYEKRKARWTLNDAIKLGKVRRGSCVVGRDCKGKVEGHHADYAKPLEVTWLCRRHHLELHAREVAA